jgi:transposase InsO family protein
MDILAIDLITSLPEGTHRYSNTLVVLDLFTKYSWTIPTRSKEGSHLILLLETHVFPFGIPNKIHSDRALEFLKGAMSQVERYHGIKHTQTSGYHPQANPVERTIGTFRNMIRTYAVENPNIWPYILPALSYAYNTAWTPNHAATPFFAMFGRHPRLQDNVFDGIALEETRPTEDVLTHIRWAQAQAHALIYNRFRELRQHRDRIFADSLFPQYAVGDKVYIHRRPRNRLTAFQPRRFGPYVVLEKYNDVVYLIGLLPDSPVPFKGSESRLYHVSHLTPYRERPEYLRPSVRTDHANAAEMKYARDDNKEIYMDAYSTDQSSAVPHSSSSSSITPLELFDQMMQSSNLASFRYPNRDRRRALPSTAITSALSQYRNQLSHTVSNSAGNIISTLLPLDEEFDLSAVSEDVTNFSNDFIDTDKVFLPPLIDLWLRKRGEQDITAIQRTAVFTYNLTVHKLHVMITDPLHPHDFTLAATKGFPAKHIICSVYGYYCTDKMYDPPDDPLYLPAQTFTVPPKMLGATKPIYFFVHVTCPARYIRNSTQTLTYDTDPDRSIIATPLRTPNAQLIVNPLYNSSTALRNHRISHNGGLPHDLFQLITIKAIEPNEIITTTQFACFEFNST